MIRTEGLTKRFNGTLAVDGLALHVRQGQVFGFLGPKGAGKTTTVRTLTSAPPKPAPKTPIWSTTAVCAAWRRHCPYVRRRRRVRPHHLNAAIVHTTSTSAGKICATQPPGNICQTLAF